MADELGKTGAPTPPPIAGAASARTSSTEPAEQGRAGQRGASGKGRDVFEGDAFSQALDRSNKLDDDANTETETELSAEDRAAIAAADGTDEHAGGDEATEETGDEAQAAEPKPATEPKPKRQTKAEKKAAEEAAAAAKTAAAAKPAEPTVFDKAAKIRLADDLPEYEAGQVAQAIREYPALWEKGKQFDTLNTEVERYRKVFRGGDISQWEGLVAKIDTDPKFKEYLNESLQQWAEYEAGLGVPAEQRRSEVPAVPSETDRKLADLQASYQRMENERAVQQVRNDESTLKAADPRLDDPDVWNLVVQRAIMQQQAGNGGYTLVHAARDMEPIVARMTAQAAGVRDAVPALVTGGGAAPRAQASREDVDMGEQSHKNLDASMAEYMRNRKKIAAKAGFQI